MLVLHLANDLKFLFRERPNLTSFDGRIGFNQIRDLAMVFQSLVSPSHHGMTEVANGHQSGAQLKLDRPPTRRAIRDALLHAGPRDRAIGIQFGMMIGNLEMCIVTNFATGTCQIASLMVA